MRTHHLLIKLLTLGFLAVTLSAFAIVTPAPQRQSQTIPLDSLDHMKLVNVQAELVTFKGRKAVRVLEAASADTGDEESLIVLPNTAFQDGVIEVDLTGEPRTGAAEGARGFVGIAFRVAADVSRFECFYLRPTNGRADDQLRRNHAVQYISKPGFPWQLLRKDFPGKYESYVDLVAGEWTKIKIEVRGEKAKLYVHGNEQPTLIVNDLKQSSTKGAIALWIGSGTLAHFSNLRTSP
jgi:hypothetical protein